ncbi:hypothetical protein QTG54_001766 [Skeletonema marinoi]|uniref:Glutathione transferase n=1 Tax=Skeletonema marinoi TaxID=267567 RepID=A0AAD8YK06_9STRA|nr:hypothetical protein QTG54_001766 [Skeletonema marinoi]
MGSSPAFTDEDNGIAIWESGAVLTYLLETYDTQHKFHPKQGTATPLERANFLHLQQYIIATVYPFLASLFLQTLKPEHEQDQGYISSAKEKCYIVSTYSHWLFGRTALLHGKCHFVYRFFDC